MTKALYAGSFDPPTNGHAWVIEEACKIFDDVVIAVARNPAKPSRWGDATQTVEMLQALTAQHLLRVVGVPLDRTVVSIAREHGCEVLIRGLRSVSDLEYERGIVEVNRDLDGGITTVFLVPPPELGHISSSMVRSLIGLQGWETFVEDYVPAAVLERLKQNEVALRALDHLPGQALRR